MLLTRSSSVASISMIAVARCSYVDAATWDIVAGLGAVGACDQAAWMTRSVRTRIAAEIRARMMKRLASKGRTSHPGRPRAAPVGPEWAEESSAFAADTHGVGD